MPEFGKRSRKSLDSADPKLRQLFDEVVKTFDCSVLCGFRNEEEQEEAYHSGKSKVQWPNSKHNTFPSMAVDVAPWPIDWRDERRFDYFAGYVQAVADRLGIKIRWGGNFNGNGSLKDDNWLDRDHFELVPMDI
jgi:peptidoglycan L-alanyl-D-glutamate endopeptidase CwlK